ncbi:unnamed protein product [Phytophthora fragariaefolia]|uniref:Unnamed protein product n=1 Tax=Phytophthora fragariaefolia TaxID=1490495 RepID=A0A9W6YHS3_9STRA|nr:unnamed protein product [Phytophthora fragariaefolia]
MQPVAKRTDTLVLLLEASKALAYNALFLTTLAFVAKLNDAPESIRTVIGSGYPFPLAVTTIWLDRAAATEKHRSVVPGTCSFCEAGEELTSLTHERNLPAGRPAPTGSRRFPTPSSTGWWGSSDGSDKIGYNRNSDHTHVESAAGVPSRQERSPSEWDPHLLRHEVCGLARSAHRGPPI